MFRAMRQGLVISVSGIRGIVGEGLSPDIVAIFSAAHGVAARRRTGWRSIVVGRDSRPSGHELAAAVESALIGVGCDVVDVGMACTPTILLTIGRECAAGGIAITASHNPAEWNALKLAGENGTFLTPEEGSEVLEMVDAGALPTESEGRQGARRSVTDATERHVQAILDDELVDAEAVKRRGFRVALDTCSGVGSLPAVPLLEALGVEIRGLHLEPSGRFPRDPEPTASNLGELAAHVQKVEADLGLAVDPDGDRLSLVDGKGVPLGEDWTLAIVADYVLSERPGPVVTNLSTSQVVEVVAREHGVETVRTPVGEVNVALGMIDVDSPIGGEGNGGIIYPPLHHTRDASMGMALLLTYLARSGGGIREMVDRYPRYTMRREKLILEGVGDMELIDRVAERFPEAEQDRRDGLKLMWRDRESWVHLRASGTEPVVRVIAEAREAEEATALVSEIRSLAAT
jgi:phosphomannomutase